MLDTDSISNVSSDDDLPSWLADAPPWLGRESQNPHIHKSKRGAYIERVSKVLDTGEIPAPPPALAASQTHVPDYDHPEMNYYAWDQCLPPGPAFASRPNYTKFQEFMFNCGKLADDTQVAPDAAVINVGRIPLSLMDQDVAEDAKS